MRSRRDATVLFHRGQLFDWLAKREAEANSEIERLDEESLLASSADALVAYFVEKYKVEPVALDRAGIAVNDHGDVRVPQDDFGDTYQASVHAVEFSVPFTGDPSLFHYQGSSLSSMLPRAEVGTGELRIVAMAEQPDGAMLRQKLEQELRLIDQWLTGVTPMVAGHNQKIANEAKRRLDARRTRALQRRNLVAAIGFPVRKRQQQAVAVPLRRRRIELHAPSSPVEGFTPEPAISNDDYEGILRTMHQMTLVVERSPAVFAVADEETIRTHFLVQLNGQLEGAATGETFNGSGKTDILIRVEGKNVFIAECKFWKGPDGLNKAIDQLMGYMSWRDTKCSVVVLVRDTEMSTVLKKVPEVVRGHALFKREISVSEETWFRAVLQHPGDPNREATVTLMTFNVPRPQPDVVPKG